LIYYRLESLNCQTMLTIRENMLFCLYIHQEVSRRGEYPPKLAFRANFLFVDN